MNSGTGTPQPSSLFAFRYERVYSWALSKPSKRRWIFIELFLRRLPLRQRLSNAWWQFRHYGDVDAFDALWRTWNRSQEAQRAS